MRWYASGEARGATTLARQIATGVFLSELVSGHGCWAADGVLAGLSPCVIRAMTCGSSEGTRSCLQILPRLRPLGIGQPARKTDWIGAEPLAPAREADRIPEAHSLLPRPLELRRVLGVQGALVAARTQLVTMTRGLVREPGNRFTAALQNTLPPWFLRGHGRPRAPG